MSARPPSSCVMTEGWVSLFPHGTNWTYLRPLIVAIQHNIIYDLMICSPSNK